MANVTPTTLTNGMGSGGATSYNTASVSPSANKLITVAVYNRRSGAIGTEPTLSGAGFTWVKEITFTNTYGNNSRFTIFRGVSSSPSSGALTIDFGGITQQMSHWHVVEWDNADTTGSNGANAIPQSKGVDNANSTTSMTCTLDNAIKSAENATYGGMGLVDVVGSGITPGDGETELVDQTNNGSSFDWRTQFQWEQGTDNSMSWTYASGGNQPTGAVIEVKAAQLGGGALVGFF